MSDMDVYSSAREMAAAVREPGISARELMELHLDRIAEREPGRQRGRLASTRSGPGPAAAEADAALARGEPVGPLHGLPHAFKDTHEVAGWRTTFGSPLFADYVPRRDDLVVERIRGGRRGPDRQDQRAGVGRRVAHLQPGFGTTRNPYDLTRSAGGSSGGAAARAGRGMVPLADGSDMGGSLRNPASFNNVVGLRPSVGRVPDWPTTNGWELTRSAARWPAASRTSRSCSR